MGPARFHCARNSTIRTLLSVAANENLALSQFDITTAFLYGELSEVIYMKQPEGFDDGSGKVCRLKRSLYGLKQAPRCWNERISKYLEKIGFNRSKVDNCLFVRERSGKKIYLALYVDDGLVAGSDEDELEKFLNELRLEFKLTMKPLSFFLGIEIHRTQNGSIQISQSKYIGKILERFGMSNCRPVTTPMLKDSSVTTENSDTKSDVKFPYRQAVGAMMYLMCGTRPDIAFAISVASRCLENPTQDDVTKVKRILRYLKGTINYCITYQQGYKMGILECYSDADHGGDKNTGHSTSGVVCLYSGGPISWVSRKQESVAVSTTEAEVVAASEACREMVYLKLLLAEFNHLKETPVLQVDNETAIKLAQNPEYHRRTKHIRLRHFYVRELVNNNEVGIQKVDTEDQLADLLTKPLMSPRIKYLLQKIGLGTGQLLNEGGC